MIETTLALDLTRFGSLHRFVGGSGSAPHKPILHLAILAEIGRGRITSNQIILTPELVAGFRA